MRSAKFVVHCSCTLIPAHEGHIALVSPLSTREIRILTGLILLVALVLPVSARTAAEKKQLAREQFATAEALREELQARPVSARTRRDYQQVTDAYRRVYYLSPASSKADAAVNAVAELLLETGRRFNDMRTLKGAIEQYEFLRREYPGSKYRVDALFTIGQIYKDDLNDREQAKTIFQDFLHRYPHTERIADAQAALAELEQPSAARKKEVKEPEPRESVTQTVPKGSPMPMVTSIRHWSTPDYTRIAIDLEAEVQYQAGRVPNPDRIFFDLHQTKLAPGLMGKTFEVQDGLLRKVRVAQYVKGITRVVLEVDDLSDYSAFLLPNPYRLIIDIHGRHARDTQLAKKEADAPENSPAKSDLIAAEKPKPPDTKPDTKVETRERTATARNEADKGGSEKQLKLSTRPADGTTSPLKPNLDAIAPTISAPADATVREPRNESGKSVAATSGAKPATTTERGKVAARKPAEERRPERAVAKRKADDTPAPELAKPAADAKLEKTAEPKLEKAAEKRIAEETEETTLAKLDPPELKTSKPTSAPTFESVAPREKLPRAKRRISDAAVHEAQPTASGERSLIRALGLKIGRIVVDAGHGGHDTGTIGPNGLQEKDLVLDVALRLGKLLESKLGADVIYTRDNDTFIPLETRTAIANQNQADLFISVHANSSRDASARGVETYYLNFTSSPEALEVAARENAVSEKSIHELQDLVKKIALKEKIEESREFAADVQRSLYSGISSKSPTVRNRGVKKAPFIVLIGANMPSILAEISFLSNPADEKRLQTPDYREKIAEYLYKGVTKYVSGLSGVKVAQQRPMAVQ